MMRSFVLRLASATMIIGLAGCGQPDAPAEPQPPAADEAPLLRADGLITQPGLGFALPPGFEATLFHQGVVQQRHIAASSEGVVFVIRRERVGGTGLLAIKDTDGDGVADITEEFSRIAGSGIAVRMDSEGQEWLYASNHTEVWRWALQPGEVAPSAQPQRIARGFRRQAEHPYKPMAFDGEGGMYVMVGAPSNACMERRRTKGSPGRNPCPQLERAAGVWRFDADAPDQRQVDAEHYATGVRNMIAFTWSRTHRGLYGVQHGRDFFNRYFPELFTPEQGADLPSEEFHRIDRGDDIGWPYSYYDHLVGERRTNPEYEAEDAPNRGRNRTDAYKEPLIGFPGHWAPADIVFYEAEAGEALFPDEYRGGAFLVFKGGWGRNPHPPQEGFQIVFVPMENGAPSGPWRTFAGGFEGPTPPISINDAVYLPFGAAVGPEGELFLGDTQQGVMWRIAYTGRTFDNLQMADTEAPPVDAEREMRDARLALAAEAYPIGAEIYAAECATCHQANGLGAAGFAPALENSPILPADPQTLIAYTLLGADSGRYSNIMPAYLDENLSDHALADALAYVRVAFSPEFVFILPVDDPEQLRANIEQYATDIRSEPQIIGMSAEKVATIRTQLEEDRGEQP